MIVEGTYTGSTEAHLVPPELEAHLMARLSRLKRVTVSKKIGKSIQKITSIELEEKDGESCQPICDLVMDIVGGTSDLEGCLVFRATCYETVEGEKEPRQSRVDFSLPSEDVEMPTIPDVLQLVMLQLNKADTTNKFLIRTLVQIATATGATQAKTIEHLAGKYIEGLGYLELSLRTSMDAKREERIAENQAQSTRDIADIIKGALPVIAGQAAEHLRGKGVVVETIPEHWKRFGQSLTPDQAKKITSDCDVEVAGRISELLDCSTTDESGVCGGLAGLMEKPGLLTPLYSILSAEQAGILQTLWARIVERDKQSKKE